MGSTSDLLVLDWCDRATAAAAVKRYHYARTLPRHLYRIGVWEGGRLVGCLVFGAAPAADACELQRVALGPHQTPASRLLRIAVALLRRRWPELTCIVAYCDPKRGHIGTMYQAAGWTYTGRDGRGRYEYLRPLTADAARCAAATAEPYPQCAGEAETSAVAGRSKTTPPRQGGANPTRPLSIERGAR